MSTPPLPFRLSPGPLLAALLVGVAGGVFAQSTVPTEGPTVELPVFTITETPVLPDPESWSYARITGFEVLSSASHRETTRLLRDFEIFRQALALVWPVPQRRSATSTLIICGLGNRFPQFVPAGRASSEIATTSLFLRNREQVAIVLDLVGTIGLTDPDTAAGDATIPDFEVDAYKQLYREYVHFVLSQGEVRPPPWLAEGVAQIVMDMEFTDKWVTFGQIESRSAAPGAGSNSAEDTGEDDGGFASATVGDQQFNVALSRRALLPMERLFAVTDDSPEARNPLGNNRWAKQCYAFVHLCLYGDNKRWQKPFAQFLQKMGNGAPTEAMFQECFGMSYKKMLEHLRGYIGFTNHQYQRFVLKDGQKSAALPSAITTATEAQIGRIKGDALRLAGHREAAHNAYRAAYIRGEREPDLLAALGVEELAAGRADRGRRLLEAAAKSGFDRPSAYVELARLRLADAATQPAAPDQKLAPAQVAPVLEALAAARRLQPPLPETYVLAAAAWTAAAEPPSREQLKLLDEGIAYFPRSAALVLNAARLNARLGDPAHAARLVQHGLRIAPDDATRSSFAQLQASLPPPPKPPTPGGSN